MNSLDSSGFKPKLSKSILSGLLPLGLVVVCLLASPSALPADSQPLALIHLLENFSKAQQTFDVTSLADLTTDDYVEVSPLGEVYSKEKMLELYAPEYKAEAPEMVIQDTQVRLFGDIGVVLAKLAYTRKGMDEQRHTLELRGTFVASKTPEGWKLASSSFTSIRPLTAK